MSNILKSTKLDIALVKPYFKTICFTLLLPIVFAAINRSLLTGVSFAMTANGHPKPSLTCWTMR